MKRILTTLLMAVGITGPFVAHLAAQDQRMIADVPFAFDVDNRTMSAGQYNLSMLTSGGSVFKLRDSSNHTILVPMGHPEDGNPNKASLTFACYGKECVLAKITPPNGLTAYALSRDSVEKNLHRRLGMASMISVKLTAR
jgi:hypothetical protein